jgi:hypothetical protein
MSIKWIEHRCILMSIHNFFTLASDSTLKSKGLFGVVYCTSQGFPVSLLNKGLSFLETP